jgi:phosphoribosyl 1,2-cyclic phosphodiesterase
MLIRCYGARGSIPVSGKQYIKYGGDTTCLEIRTKNDQVIIVDAGSGIRRLGNRLKEENHTEFHFLFTHSHWDHILGFPFFKPLYDKNARISMIGCPLTQGDIYKLIDKSMSAPFFPLTLSDLKAQIDYTPECRMGMAIDSIEISTINLSHPNLGSGYKFVEDGKTLVFLTDNELAYTHRGGCSFDEYAAFSQGADLLIHDAEYTPEQYRFTKSWGHSTYLDALSLAVAADVRQFGLFHHNQDRTDKEQDDIVADCREVIDHKNLGMRCFALTQDTEIEL